MSLPLWDNLTVTRLAWLSLNIPNYHQTFSFPMGTAATQGPGVSLAFWPACRLPAAHCLLQLLQNSTRSPARSRLPLGHALRAPIS